MANAKDLKKRIGTVKNTQQITKAMKMVSAAKLRRAQESILSLRPFAQEISKIIATISNSDSEDVSHPLLAARAETKSVLVIVVTSDRGLCGGFNSNVIKAAQRFLRSENHKYKTLDFAFVGKKGYEYFKERKPGKYHAGFFTKINFKKSQDFANDLIKMYLDGVYDEIKFIYNEFKSAIAQKVNVEGYLPVKEISETQSEQQKIFAIFEPSPQKIFNEILPRHFATQAHRIFLESLASEHAARMTAMENASKNASEMMKKLALEYNKTRQGAITKELLEIISGSEAQKG